MKLQLLIISLLKTLVLTNQEDGLPVTVEYDDSFINYETTDVFVSKPCEKYVPGLSALGLIIIYMMVFLLSTIGNSVVIYVVRCMKKGRGSTDIYLMHLAIADLLFSLTLPFFAVNAHSGWIFGNFLCKILSGFQEAAVYSGVFLLVCISVDRLFAIVRATRSHSSHYLVKVVCSLVWLAAGLLSMPMLIQKESMFATDLNQTICHENLTGESSDRWRVSIRILRHTVGFFLPLVVMAICYSWTLVTLCHTRNQQRHKAIRVIIAVVLAFVLCWLPYNITVLIDTLIRGGTIEEPNCDSRYIVEMTLNVTQMLAFTHCAVNPVLYAFIGQKFRNHLVTALYKQGLISNRMRMAYRKSSINSIASTRSRITSA